MSNPALYDVNTLVQAGLDPSRVIPSRRMCKTATKPHLKEDIKKQLRVIDEQDHVNKGTWYNIPNNLTSQELEKMLYYKGQLAFFYIKDLDQFYFMPYALDGSIDFYGRYNTIHPVPMTSGLDEKTGKAQAEYLSNIKLKCVYGIKMPEELEIDDLYNSAVLLHDYTKQLGENIIPRQQLNDGLLDVMSECIPFMRTSLINNTGIHGVRVQDADQADSVRDGVNSFTNAALDGETMVPIIGSIEFQELTGSGSNQPDNYMMAMQELNNFRLQTHGIQNGGLYSKNQYQNTDEVALNGGTINNQLQDGVSIRQNFCNIVNSIWNLGIWYEPSENMSGADLDGDGLLYDRDDEGQSSGFESDNKGGQEE